MFAGMVVPRELAQLGRPLPTTSAKQLRLDHVYELQHMFPDSHALSYL